MNDRATEKPKTNHPLAVYSVLFLAIIFLAVSIYSGDIKDAKGPSLAFVILLAAFFIKMAIDDYMYFHLFGTDKEKAHTGLRCSLAMYLLIAFALANATTNLPRAAFFLLLAMLVGLLWLTKNYLGVSDKTVEDQKRHVGWAYINVAFVAALSTYIAFRFEDNPSIPQWLFYALTALVVFDAWKYGTLLRLVELPHRDKSANPPLKRAPRKRRAP